LLVLIYAGSKELFHVVGHAPKLCSVDVELRNTVIATKVSANQFGRIHLDFGAYELPSGIDIGAGPGDLQVIHIDDEEALQLGIPRTSIPSFGSAVKSKLLDLCIEVLLPDTPRVGVAIQCHLKRNNRSSKPGFPSTFFVRAGRGTLGTTLALLRVVKPAVGPAS
jgi:hypothetical protein